MSLITMKFGGTSVGTVEAMQRVAQITQTVRAQGYTPIVIVSAMSGVTNALIQAAQAAENGDLAQTKRLADDLRSRHIHTAAELVSVANRRTRLQDDLHNLLDSFEQLCQGIYILREVTPRGMDVVSSLGERLSVRLVAAHFEDVGLRAEAIDATELIVTDDNFQNAMPDMEASRHKTQARLNPLLARGTTPVITGFIGATPNGTITTLGRGGSDYSGGIIAACTDSQELWIWTDVDGVMTTDPRLTPQARTIEVLSYGEIGELAYFGAKVLHPRTILPVMDVGMPIRVLNTFNPEHAGTRILPTAPPSPYPFKAITAIQDVHLMKVKGRGMVGVPGIAGRSFTAVARAGASMLLFAQSSSEQSFCFAVPSATSARVKLAIEAELSLERGRKDVDDVDILEEVVIVTVVGAQMQGTAGVAAKVFGALGAAGVNILVIAQGVSEYSISMVVAQNDMLKAVEALHALLV